MSCIGFLTPRQRAALRASSAGGQPLSRFASPPMTASKVERLRRLAGSPVATIRESAALAINVPVDVLVELAADPSDGVRCCVARNRRTPDDLLAALAGDVSSQVRAWVAANASTTRDVREALASDEDPTVRAIARWAGSR